MRTTILAFLLVLPAFAQAPPPPTFGSFTIMRSMSGQLATLVLEGTIQNPGSPPGMIHMTGPASGIHGQLVAVAKDGSFKLNAIGSQAKKGEVVTATYTNVAGGKATATATVP